jgi:hypothetical protein
LALDERREAFRPTLWYIDARSYAEGGLNYGKPKPELKQVWVSDAFFQLVQNMPLADSCISSPEYISTAVVAPTMAFLK